MSHLEPVLSAYRMASVAEVYVTLQFSFVWNAWKQLIASKAKYVMDPRTAV